MIGTILLVFAFVFAAIAAFFGPAYGRVHFGWLSIAFWILSVLLGGAHAITAIH
jgi:hypothetical protein